MDFETFIQSRTVRNVLVVSIVVGILASCYLLIGKENSIPTTFRYCMQLRVGDAGFRYKPVPQSEQELSLKVKEKAVRHLRKFPIHRKGPPEYVASRVCGPSVYLATDEKTWFLSGPPEEEGFCVVGAGNIYYVYSTDKNVFIERGMCYPGNP